MSLVKVEEIISDRGLDILNKIFRSNITVLEKLSGSSFYMKNTNEEKIFFRQYLNNPINLVDRTLNKLWNEPLSYLEKFDSMTLPDEWVFKFEWFFSDSPQGLKYSRKPKNGLVLTGIWDQRGNVVSDVEEYEMYNSYFQIESIPLLWEGTLSEDQKNLITIFTKTPHESLMTEFGTTSFIRHFLNVLNPKIKGCLQEDILDPIEGVIIKFNDNSIEDLILIDQVFEDITKKIKFNRSREPKTIYSVILVDILHWFNENSLLNTVSIKGDSLDAKYLNLIVDLWKMFVNENGSRYIDLDFQLPNELKSDVFRLNKTFINDPVALKMLDENIEYENLLQIFLAGFKKKKKRPIGLLTEDLLGDFNSIVDKIKSKISAVYESRMPSYKEFKMMQSILNEEEEIYDDLVDEPLRDGIVDQDEKTGVQEEPEIEEIPLSTVDIPVIEVPIVNSFIDPVLVEFRKFSDVMIFYNQNIPSKNLLNTLSKVSNETDKKVIIFSPEGNSIKEDVLKKFSVNYSSIVKELIVDDLSWETLNKKYSLSDIYVDPTDYEWVNLIFSSLNTKVEVQQELIYNVDINDAVTHNDFVKFKENVPETVEGDWLNIVALKNEVQE